MNLPERTELFDDDDNDIKLTEEPVQKMASASTFIINKEDHTLGNLIRMQLIKDKTVLFAGYKVPHPLEHHIEVRVQTSNDSTPREAFNKSLTNIMGEMERLKQQFENEVERVKGTSSTW